MVLGVVLVVLEVVLVVLEVVLQLLLLKLLLLQLLLQLGANLKQKQTVKDFSGPPKKHKNNKQVMSQRKKP